MCKRLNCWEFRNCGMEPDGIFSRLYGECPVPRMMKLDGTNGGSGAGRACWQAVTKHPAHKSFACRNNRLSCHQCDFYLRVQDEENYSHIAEEREASATP